MGEWSEAIEDGVMCPNCKGYLIDEHGNRFTCDCPPVVKPVGKPGFERPSDSDKLGPNWLPPR
ncbi:Hypothetical protein NGAL_HAMBI2605_10510 [Neorhizobium galegae bv. orientalis]|nr:Hypothetical protein NGAL_HAMBI2605_10510 [Neorhizobium galegae bv. orientalis]